MTTSMTQNQTQTTPTTQTGAPSVKAQEFVGVTDENSFFNEAEFRLQLDVMLRLQDNMNEMVFHDWKERGLAWHRAIYMEAGELLDHMGSWKWWKKGTPDVPQALMELVDIWHFGLSWYIERSGDNTSSGNAVLVDYITRGVKEGVKSCRFGGFNQNNGYSEKIDAYRMEEVDTLICCAGAGKFDTISFVHLMASMGLDFSTLFVRYVGKNALNRFRQINGYKQGTYLKDWAGREDNVHLDEILQEFRGMPADHLMIAVMSQLEDRYRSLFDHAVGPENA